MRLAVTGNQAGRETDIPVVSQVHAGKALLLNDGFRVIRQVFAGDVGGWAVFPLRGQGWVFRRKIFLCAGRFGCGAFRRYQCVCFGRGSSRAFAGSEAACGQDTE